MIRRIFIAVMLANLSAYGADTRQKEEEGREALIKYRQAIPLENRRVTMRELGEERVTLDPSNQSWLGAARALLGKMTGSFDPFVTGLRNGELSRLDPRLDTIVLPDGKTLLTGRVVDDYANVVSQGYYKSVGILSMGVRFTTNPTEHFLNLKAIAEHAAHGNIDALGFFYNLFEEGYYAYWEYAIPWPYVDIERSRWFKHKRDLFSRQIVDEKKVKAAAAIGRSASSEPVFIAEAASVDSGDSRTGGRPSLPSTPARSARVSSGGSVTSNAGESPKE